MTLDANRHDPALISIEALDYEIASLSARLMAQEYELLVLIRTFDERGGWLKWGSANCAEWLHWRCDLSVSTAREKVRVAHALKALPAISKSFADGRLSYSKVRALTRVANHLNEQELLDFALNVSAAIVEQRCQQIRNVAVDAVDVARRAYERRSVSAFRNGVTGTMTLSIEIPLEDGELVLSALDKVPEESEDAADSSTIYRTRQADALVTLCKTALAGEHSCGNGQRRSSGALRGGLEQSAKSQRRVSTADQYQVILHTDRSALTDEPAADARSDLPVETARRLTCDGSVVSLTSHNGKPVDIGRKHRTVPTALKRALWARDKHCRFPGCSRTRFVDAHHVEHWARGGETNLDNLMLLCSHHHRLVHEGGFQIFVDCDGCRSFRRPDGRAVPACGYRTEDQDDEYLESEATFSRTPPQSGNLRGGIHD